MFFSLMFVFNLRAEVIYLHVGHLGRIDHLSSLLFRVVEQ